MTDSHKPPNPDAEPPRPLDALSGQWFKGTVAATLVGGLLGVVLGYLVLLPFFLGVFFFLLLGQLPGAVLFRFGHRVRPLSIARLWLGITPVVATTWLVAGYVEYRALPGQLTEKIRRCAAGYPKGYDRTALRANVVQWLHRDFLPRYGSSGPVAYVRWASRSGKIEFPHKSVELSSADPSTSRPTITLQLSYPAIHQLNQPAAQWIVRVVGSLLMMVLAMWLQVGPLRKPESSGTPADNAEPSPPDKNVT